MTATILLSILSGVSFAGAGVGYKTAERSQCRSSVFILVFAITGGAFAGIKAFFETTVWLEPKLWLLGIAMGLLFDLAICFIMQANRLGPASVSWTVLNLGLLVPIFISPLIIEETVLWLDPIIVTLFILMLLMFARGMKNTGEVEKGRHKLHILMLLGIFLAQGLFLLGNKIKYLLFDDANTAGLTFIVYLSGAAAVLLVIYTTQKRLTFLGSELKAGAITGICNSLGVILLLSAMSLPATIVFPLSASIALLGGVFLTSLIYGERLNRMKMIGVMLGLMALILAVFRENLVSVLTGI
jgi:multidrug transporter EmrE-like cation transporter